MVPGRIAWTQLREWAIHHDMQPDDFALLDACVSAMDGVYLEIQATRAAMAAKR